MKKLILVVALAVSIVGISSVTVFASPFGDNNDDACSITGNNDKIICGNKNKNEELIIQERIKAVLEIVYFWTGILAVVVIVIGGIKYMTSLGEPEKINSAKRTIMYALIGLILTLAAFAITELIINALEGHIVGETSEVVNDEEEIIDVDYDT